MQCPQLAVSQPGLKASLNPSCHRVTSGASGLQVLLLTAVSYGLSFLQSLLPALLVLLPMLQLGWTSVPKAGSSSSRGLPATTALLSPNTPWACPSWLQLHQEGLDINSKAPLCSYAPNPCWRQSRAHWDCALPEETRLVEEGFTEPSTQHHL